MRRAWVRAKSTAGKFSEDAANGIGDILRLQLGSRHLVEEGEKGVVVVPIKNEDITRGSGQGSNGPEAAETGTDHDHSRFLAAVHLSSLKNSLFPLMENKGR